jgi:hypothetical protein
MDGILVPLASLTLPSPSPLWVCLCFLVVWLVITKFADALLTVILMR